MTYIPDEPFQIILDFCNDRIKQKSKTNKDIFLKLFSNVVDPLRQKQTFYHENDPITPSMINFYSKRYIKLNPLNRLNRHNSLYISLSCS